MRPNTIELIDRISDAFTDAIVDELHSDYARSRASAISNLLKHLRTRAQKESLVLQTQCEAIEQALGTISETISRSMINPSSAISRVLDDSTRKTVQALSLSERQIALAGLLEELISHLPHIKTDSISSMDYDAIVGEVREACRTLIDGELQLVETPIHGGRDIS